MSVMEAFGTLLAMCAGAALGTVLASYYLHRKEEKRLGLKQPAAGHLEVTENAPLFFQINHHDPDVRGEYMVRCLECAERWYYGPLPTITAYPETNKAVFAHSHRGVAHAR